MNMKKVVITWVVIVAVWLLLLVGVMDAYGVHGNSPVATVLWNGLVVSPERRCAPYDEKAYAYPSLELKKRLLAKQPLISPYTGRVFKSLHECDLEHVTARAEAHDSGMCAMPDSVRHAFVRDPLNQTFAAASVNRWQKRSDDVAEWRPELVGSWCWMATRIVSVKRKYHLSVDEKEVAALKEMLATCQRE